MNHLGDAASAYLRSAAHQPIHWYSWGDEAFDAARETGRPVLLDIGAVWCHWCHVMDRESYEDPALAALLNERFVCIKVDRDERPDVDARYQRAVQTLTHQGGWPLTAFLTPGGDVFYGGTYFPPADQHGRPGFRTVLESVLGVYHGRRDQVAAQAAAIRRAVVEHLDESAPGALVSGVLAAAEDAIVRSFDPRHGGFGTAPKFPHPAAIGFLLQRWFDQPAPALREIVDRTLQGMARGGIHDQLGGGMHRYSVDREWIVPHFEKMSYDNSELLRSYTDAYAAFGTAEYREAAIGIMRWVREVLTDSAPGYGTSQDADVGLDDDGDYFTWTRAEAAALLDPAELDVAAAYYDIGTAGEMHHNPGKNVLFVAAPVSAVAARLGIDAGRAGALLESARAKLFAGRQARTAPFVDRTRYTAWNAMMASAMLRASAMFDDEWARAHALATLTAIRDASPEPDAVAHTAGGAGGMLDDQVQAAAAALDAWESTADRAWLAWAEALMQRVWRDYGDEAAGGLYDLAAGRAGSGLLPARAKPVQDAPTPSANGVAAIVAARLGAITGSIEWSERARAIVEAFAGGAAQLGLHGATLFAAADWVLQPATELVVAGGTAGDGALERMHRRALSTFVPRRVVRRVQPGKEIPAGTGPALSGMLATATSGPRGFICRGAACGLPADGEVAWARALADLLPPGDGRLDSSLSGGAA